MTAALLLALCGLVAQDPGGPDWDERLAPVDRVVAEGLDRGEMPGCVVLVGRRDGVVWRRAYGDRATRPRREAMTA